MFQFHLEYEETGCILPWSMFVRFLSPFLFQFGVELLERVSLKSRLALVSASANGLFCWCSLDDVHAQTTACLPEQLIALSIIPIDTAC